MARGGEEEDGEGEGERERREHEKRSRMNFKHRAFAAKLLHWISSKTEVYSESRSIMCKAFLEPVSPRRDEGGRASAAMADGGAAGASAMESEATGNGSRAYALLSELEAEATALLHRHFASDMALKKDLFDELGGRAMDAPEAQSIVFWMLVTLKYLPSTFDSTRARTPSLSHFRRETLRDQEERERRDQMMGK